MEKIDILGTDNATAKLLVSAYEAIMKASKSVAVVNNYNLREEIAQKLFPFFSNRNQGEIRLKNLFKIEAAVNAFYLAQIEIDCRFTYGNKYGFKDSGMEYYIVGIARINSEEYGNIFLEPKEIPSNKLVKAFADFLNRKHNLVNALSHKYTISVSDMEKAKSFFTNELINAFEKTNNLNLKLSNDLIVLSFTQKMDSNQTMMLFNIFNKINFK